MEPDSKDENKIRDFMTQKYEKKRYVLHLFSFNSNISLKKLHIDQQNKLFIYRSKMLKTFVTLEIPHPF